MDSVLFYLSTEVAENIRMAFADPQGEKKKYFAGVIIPTVDFSLFHISKKKLCTSRDYMERKRERKTEREENNFAML